MGSFVVTNRNTLGPQSDTERKSVADLWNDALSAYHGTVGKELRPYYRDADEMINSGLKAAEAFRSWRNDGSRVAKLRSLFMSNIELIEKGTSKILAAASASFPPASAISTCLTFVLTGAKNMSADLDVVVAFFEDMNSFLQRVSIIETRVPSSGAYQGFLTNVFSCLLKMMAIAQRYIGDSRFKQWLKSSILGKDSELASSRKAMDTALSRLQSATEFAILRNTEDTVENQMQLRRMQEELYRNQVQQQRIAANHSLMLDTILARQDQLSNGIQVVKGGVESLQGGVSHVQDGVDNILQILVGLQLKSKSEGRQTKVSQGASTQAKPGQTGAAQAKSDTSKDSRNWLRSELPEVPDCRGELQLIKASAVDGTSQFIFDQPSWSAWESSTREDQVPPVLAITGGPGMGKSHLAASAFEYFQRQIRQDPQNKICATYFCFRKDVDSMNELEPAIVSSLIQIADQSTALSGQLRAIMSPDDFEMPELGLDLWGKLLAPIFGKGSSYQLYMVLDGLDDMDDDYERDQLTECFKLIRKHALRIKVLCTTRSDYKPDLDTTHMTELLITRDLILPDMKKILRERLQSSDTAYSGLSRFTRFLKVKIISSIEKHADGLVYAEEMLRYISSIGREGAVSKLLEEENMPKNVSDLFSRTLKQCQRRIPQDTLSVMKSLLAWISFCFRPLRIEEGNSLFQLLSPKSNLNAEEEVQEAFSQFLQIANTFSAGHTDLGTAIGTAIPMSAVSPSWQIPEFDDGKLQITFRERSIREFFTNSTVLSSGDLRTPALHAHSQIFLICSKVISNVAQGSGSDSPASKTLYEYAVLYCLQHWCQIDPREHSDSKNVAIVEAFTSIIMDGHLAKGAESLNEDEVYETMLGGLEEQFKITWKLWSKWVDGAPMKRYVDQSTLEYWTGGVDNALVPLAKSHIHNWLSAADVTEATQSYAFAKNIIKATKYETLLEPEQDESGEAEDEPIDEEKKNSAEEEIFALARVLGLKLSSNAHYAIGVQLHQRGVHEKAISEIQWAIETCHDHNEQARNYQQLAKIALVQERWDDAQHFAELSLSCSENVHLTTVNDALITKGLAQMELGSFGEASRSFAKARLCNPNVVEGENLWLEVYTHWENDELRPAMSTVMSFKPIERMRLLTYANAWNEWSEPDVHILLLLISARSEQSDDLIGIYEEVIKSLDAENAGAPLRLNLAYLQWRVRNDTETAKVLLNQILDSSSSGEGYKLTEADPSVVAVRAINMMSDILLKEFQSSKDPNIKEQLLAKLRELEHRNLPQLLRIQQSQLLPYYLVQAKMLHKMGPATEYAAVMQQAFNICIDNLSDSVTWNDAISVYHLAMVLAQMGSLETQAQMMNSAQFYWLDPDNGEGNVDDDEGNDHDAEGNGIDTEPKAVHTPHPSTLTKHDGWAYPNADAPEGDHGEQQKEPPGNDVTAEDETRQSDTSQGVEGEDDEYDIITDGTNVQYCKGQCFPRVAFDRWDEETPMYQCLTCTESLLCQECYDVRIRFNMEGKPETEPDFCCNKGKYMRGPAVGWKGMKAGEMHFDADPETSESPEPISFTVFLETVKQAWKDAWDEFWTEC